MKQIPFDSTQIENLLRNVEERKRRGKPLESTVEPGIIPTSVKRIIMRTPKIAEVFRRHLILTAIELTRELKNNPTEEKAEKIKEVKRDYTKLIGILTKRNTGKLREDIRALKRSVQGRQKTYSDVEYFRKHGYTERDVEETKAMLEMDERKLEQKRRKLNPFQRKR